MKLSPLDLAPNDYSLRQAKETGLSLAALKLSAREQTSDRKQTLLSSCKNQQKETSSVESSIDSFDFKVKNNKFLLIHFLSFLAHFNIEKTSGLQFQ